MKKNLCLMIVFIPAFLFAKPTKNEKVLIDRGIELCQMIKEKVDSEVYLKALLGPENEIFSELLEDFSEVDFKTLESVTRVRIDEQLLYDKFIRDEISEDDEKCLPKNLKKELMDKISIGVAQFWNGRQGSLALALSAVLSSSSVFDVNFSFDKEIYIFKYKNAYQICVAYLHGKDKAVSATATIIFEKGFLESLKELPEDIKDFVTIENIDLK